VSSHFGVKQTLELLEKLRATVADFAAREQKLRQEFSASTSAEGFRRDRAGEQASDRFSGKRGQAETDFKNAKAAADTQYAQRQSRIAQAHKNSQKLVLQKIENDEGNRKHKLQKETLQSKRDHEAGLAKTEKAFAEFRGTLTGEHDAITALETRARKAFSGFGKFVQLLSRPEDTPETDLARDEYHLIVELRELLNKTEADLGRFQKLLLPGIFKLRWLILVLALCQIPLVPVLQHFGNNTFTYTIAGASAAGVIVFGFILHYIAQRQSSGLARNVASGIAKARRLDDLCFAKSDARHARDLERVEFELKSRKQWVEQEWIQTLEKAAASRETQPSEVEAKHARIAATHERLSRAKLERMDRAQADVMARLDKEFGTEAQQLQATTAGKESGFAAEFQTKFAQLESDWKNQIQPLYQTLGELRTSAETMFPDSVESWGNWTPPEQFEQMAKFGRLDVDIAQLAGAMPKDERLPLPGPAQISLPLLLEYPNEGSLLIETKESGRDEAIAALNNVILRLLSVAAPGRLSFTVIDPVGLGQNFSGTMHLADYAEHLINSHIWTQPAQIEEKLAELNEHMEKVIQMYLRNEYATIAEYNEQAGNIAEKYHFLVAADFPANFSDAAAKRLLNIASSGARCGVYTLIHWNENQPQPADFLPDELRKSSVNLVCKGNRFTLVGKNFSGTHLKLDAPPTAEVVTGFIHKVGQSNRDSNRVEVPFAHVAPPEAKLWSEETTNELRVPIGRTGATKLQYLAIGKGTRQHALLAGKTGSGKSTLFHVIITNLALWSSPEQVEFYLIDFKKGVEFKCYAEKKLPHARVVAIESNREFGLSVLQRVDDELKRRGELFRKLGVQDLAGYKRDGGTESMPRTLLMIDEFQEFFVEDDRVSQNASALLDRIVRQGRAFGIHVILGSQTLGGAYTMARTTMGQMVIRIALQCNEADAYLIMDDNNPAPRLLSRPGEGIYNDAAGNIQGNSPFQAVWISDEERDVWLEKIRARADASGKSYPDPIVFEGDAPADVRENAVLQDLLRTKPTGSPNVARIWLGAPNSIKGPTEAVFERQTGNNLLIVGQRDEAILAILSVAVIALAAQFPAGGAKVLLLDGNPPGSTSRGTFDRLAQAHPQFVSLAKPNEISDVMNSLIAELKTRAESDTASNAPATFVILHDLQKIARLRYEDDFSFSSSEETAANPAAQLNRLITEGPALGLHVIATCDTYNNANRFLSKKAFSEFEMRVLFQMSANDSASLIDNPKAGALGLNRAIYYNEQEGYLELFRPYALPGEEWIEEAQRNLSRQPDV